MFRQNLLRCPGSSWEENHSHSVSETAEKQRTSLSTAECAAVHGSPEPRATQSTSPSSPSSVVAESCANIEYPARPINPMAPHLWKMYQDYVTRTQHGGQDPAVSSYRASLSGCISHATNTPSRVTSSTEGDVQGADHFQSSSQLQPVRPGTVGSVSAADKICTSPLGTLCSLSSASEDTGCQSLEFHCNLRSLSVGATSIHAGDQDGRITPEVLDSGDDLTLSMKFCDSSTAVTRGEAATPDITISGVHGCSGSSNVEISHHLTESPFQASATHGETNLHSSDASPFLLQGIHAVNLAVASMSEKHDLGSSDLVSGLQVHEDITANPEIISSSCAETDCNTRHLSKDICMDDTCDVDDVTRGLVSAENSSQPVAKMPSAEMSSLTSYGQAVTCGSELDCSKSLRQASGSLSPVILAPALPPSEELIEVTVHAMPGQVTDSASDVCIQSVPGQSNSTTEAVLPTSHPTDLDKQSCDTTVSGACECKQPSEEPMDQIPSNGDSDYGSNGQPMELSSFYSQRRVHDVPTMSEEDEPSELLFGCGKPWYNRHHDADANSMSSGTPPMEDSRLAVPSSLTMASQRRSTFSPDHISLCSAAEQNGCTAPAVESHEEDTQYSEHLLTGAGSFLHPPNSEAAPSVNVDGTVECSEINEMDCSPQDDETQVPCVKRQDGSAVTVSLPSDSNNQQAPDMKRKKTRLACFVKTLSIFSQSHRT